MGGPADEGGEKTVSARACGGAWSQKEKLVGVELPAAGDNDDGDDDSDDGNGVVVRRWAAQFKSRDAMRCEVARARVDALKALKASTE